MKTILIVDDDSINCLLAKHALAQDYRALAVKSGKDALAFLENTIPDLILMDIEMPEMDGKEVVRRIKACEKWSMIPVVFLTADVNPMTEAECLQCGAEDYITKPFVPDVMRSRVAKILEAHELRKDLQLELEKKTLKSLTDALTGLNNRDYLEKELEKLLQNGHTGTLFMTDLDNFKSMNDTYGHMVGDEVLIKFAEAMRYYSDEKDIVCRLGGDEFVAFFTDLTDKDAAAGKAARIIKLFAEKMGALGYAGIVSVSIGAKITTGDENFEELYSKADETLYFVKENGKNAYHFYDDMESGLDVTLSEINTTADLDDIHRMMLDSQDDNKGAFHVDYEEFKIIYDFALRCVTRNNQKVQTLLLTLDYSNVVQNEIKPEEIMDILKETVIASLRTVDTGTKYSSSQYIVLLMDTDSENGSAVAERVINKFYQNETVAASGVKATFDIQALGQ